MMRGRCADASVMVRSPSAWRLPHGRACRAPVSYFARARSLPRRARQTLHLGDLGIPARIPGALLAHPFRKSGMDRHEIPRRRDAALLEIHHILGDLREGRIDLGELSGVLLDDR